MRSTHFKQVGVACAVELSAGRMVWCASATDQWEDLTSPPEARRAVRELLTDFGAVADDAEAEAD